MQCQCVTKKGTQCTRKASEGDFCYQHQTCENRLGGNPVAKPEAKPQANPVAKPQANPVAKPIARPKALLKVPPRLKATVKAPQIASSFFRTDRLLEEVLNLVFSSYDNMLCCLEGYEKEIKQLQRDRTKGGQLKGTLFKGIPALEGIRSIESRFLRPFFGLFEKFYYIFLEISLKKESSAGLLRYLSNNLPVIVEDYMRLLHLGITETPMELISLLFPPPNFPVYPETKEPCEKTQKGAVTSLNCIRSDMMQMVTRFAMLGEQLGKSATTENLPEDLGKEITKFAETSKIYANVLNEMQRYLDGYLLCRPDYCDEKVCIEESKGMFRGKTCKPRKSSYSDADWYEKTYFSKLLGPTSSTN